MICSVDVVQFYDAMYTHSLHTFTGQRLADVTMTFTVSWASGAGSFLFLCLRFLRCHISLCFSISHRRHVPSGGGRRTAATAADTRIWRFCGEKMKSRCACRARSLGLARHRQKMWRDSKKKKKGNKHVLGPPHFPVGLFHFTLSKTYISALRAGRGLKALTPRSLQLSGVLPERRADPDLLLIQVV